MDYRKIITINPNIRGGKPCIKGTRISVYDVLSWLASGMTPEQITDDFPELTLDHIYASLKFAAEKEAKVQYLRDAMLASKQFFEKNVD